VTAPNPPSVRGFFASVVLFKDKVILSFDLWIGVISGIAAYLLVPESDSPSVLQGLTTAGIAVSSALVGVVIWAVFAAGLAEGDGAPSLFELIGAATKLAYIEVVWVAFGLAAAALVRSTGLAVGLALGFTFVEQLLFILPSYQRLSISGATTGIFGLELPAIVGQPLAVPGVGASVLILAGWGVVSGFAAWAALTYRDA